MRLNLQSGKSDLEGIIIILVIIFILIISPKDDSPQSGSSWTLGTPAGYSSSRSNSSELILGSGNASYVYQPYEEYITIDNVGSKSVNITGWQLKNGKDKRPYAIGGQLQRFSADIAIIPQAVRLLSPTGGNILQDIVLESGEKAVITTGRIAVQTPYQIVSFKESICTGYIEGLPEYAFDPPLFRNCPDPGREPGIEALDVQCRTFVKRLSRCETPEIGEYDRDKEWCSNCVDGELLSSACTAFIKDHFSYRGCAAYHSSDKDYYGKTWRIFIGRGWEMWAKDYETIELFNSSGELVNFTNY